MYITLIVLASCKPVIANRVSSMRLSILNQVMIYESDETVGI